MEIRVCQVPATLCLIFVGRLFKASRMKVLYKEGMLDQRYLKNSIDNLQPAFILPLL
jgi:hypothetical protein